MAAGLSAADLEREVRERWESKARALAQLAMIDTELEVLIDELCARAGRAGRTGVVLQLRRRRGG